VNKRQGQKIYKERKQGVLKTREKFPDQQQEIYKERKAWSLKETWL
jgi:hypothetical protein